MDIYGIDDYDEIDCIQEQREAELRGLA